MVSETLKPKDEKRRPLLTLEDVILSQLRVGEVGVDESKGPARIHEW